MRQIVGQYSPPPCPLLQETCLYICRVPSKLKGDLYDLDGSLKMYKNSLAVKGKMDGTIVGRSYTGSVDAGHDRDALLDTKVMYDSTARSCSTYIGRR